MTRSVLTPTTKYAPISTSTWLMFTVPIASAILVPTSSERALSTTYDITAAIAGHAGFTTGRETLTAPIYGTSSYAINVAGGRTTEASWIEFWADRLGQDIRTVLDEGDDVDFEFLPAGIVVGSYTEVWRTGVNSLSQPKDPAAIARVRAGLNIQSGNQRVLVAA